MGLEYMPRNGQGWCQGGLSGAAVWTGSPMERLGEGWFRLEVGWFRLQGKMKRSLMETEPLVILVVIFPCNIL